MNQQISLQHGPTWETTRGFLQWLVVTSVLIVASLTTGCGSKPPSADVQLGQDAAELRTVINQQVTDPARRAQLLERANALEQAVQDFTGKAQRFAESLQALNGDYDTPPEKLRELFKQFDNQRIAMQSKVKDLHFQMLALTTPDEWSDIGRAEIRSLETMGALIKSGNPEGTK
jgi:hypothetical protein